MLCWPRTKAVKVAFGASIAASPDEPSTLQLNVA